MPYDVVVVFGNGLPGTVSGASFSSPKSIFITQQEIRLLFHFGMDTPAAVSIVSLTEKVKQRFDQFLIFHIGRYSL